MTKTVSRVEVQFVGESLCQRQAIVARVFSSKRHTQVMLDRETPCRSHGWFKKEFAFIYEMQEVLWVMMPRRLQYRQTLQYYLLTCDQHSRQITG